jgi:hypothetical protein
LRRWQAAGRANRPSGQLVDPRSLPGGRGATCVGFGVRVPSAAAPFWTTGVLSGALNTGTSGGFTTTVDATAEIFIGSILLVASDSGRVETNDW